ncbi:MAG TPA: hypothetical protein VNJ70_11965 [Thermoanaerobaculia bacterium]|nr:hypothetical protein [Thermoanaerobaculia bacterium]
MTAAAVEAIADAVLFEGYLLYPYRGSALKNRFRWTFGVLQPRAVSEAVGGREPWWSQSECLIRGDAETVIEVVVRLLHPLRRSLLRDGGAAAGTAALPREVDAIEEGELRLESGEEASVLRVELGPWRLGDLLARELRQPFAGAGRDEVEELLAPDGAPLGAVRRRQEALAGVVEAAALQVDAETCRLTVRVENVTPAPAGGQPPGDVQRCFASTHWIVSATGGEVISLVDPPATLRAAAAACRNVGVWPVLVGERGAGACALCSPIILDDHPQIAPESPGDAFDGTEIDELLALRIGTLTPEERRQMAAADPRAAALLARTEGLGEPELARLHGAVRGLSVASRSVGGTAGPLPGSRVRLRPAGRRDIFDLALAGRTATVVSLERDYDGRSYVTVTVDDDPGRDLGAEGKPGHRFFFTPDEVEPLAGP